MCSLTAYLSCKSKHVYTNFLFLFFVTTPFYTYIYRMERRQCRKKRTVWKGSTSFKNKIWYRHGDVQPWQNATHPFTQVKQQTKKQANAIPNTKYNILTFFSKIYLLLLLLLQRCTFFFHSFAKHLRWTWHANFTRNI